MSATIIAFPGTGTCHAVRPVNMGPIATQAPSISATALAAKFTDHFLPVVRVSVDLLEADERDFEARCRRMLDADGAGMIDELCAELQIVGRQMQILVDGIELTRARLRTAMARLATDCASAGRRARAERDGFHAMPVTEICRLMRSIVWQQILNSMLLLVQMTVKRDVQRQVGVGPFVALAFRSAIRSCNALK